ncbi:unnamed protein product [Boreogadus saida]
MNPQLYYHHIIFLQHLKHYNDQRCVCVRVCVCVCVCGGGGGGPSTFLYTTPMCLQSQGEVHPTSHCLLCIVCLFGEQQHNTWNGVIPFLTLLKEKLDQKSPAFYIPIQTTL